METIAFENVRAANRPLKKFALMSASGLSRMRLRENVCRQRRLPMNRFPIVFSSIALVALAGCATESVISSATVAGQAVGAAGPSASAGATTTPAPAPVALRAGYGRIESVTVVPSGSTVHKASKSSKRITMRMEDGTMQHFESKAGVSVGEHAEITSNGTLRSLARVGF
jgi:hypothetical protein